MFVTTPETCKRVLLDDDAFKPGWPRSAMELIGKKSFIGISFEEHKRLRRLTASPVNGHEALSVYLQYIEENVVSALKKWATMGQIEFLTEIRKVTFRIIMYIFLGSESEPVMEALEREYTALNYGVRAMAINLPGFAYHKALKVKFLLPCTYICLEVHDRKLNFFYSLLILNNNMVKFQARKNLVAALQSVVDQRRKQRKGITLSKKKDMMDALMDVEDENGRKLSDEEIIDILLMYLNAGHESSGHIIMWATIFLQEHPEFLQKAKVSVRICFISPCLVVDLSSRRLVVILVASLYYLLDYIIGRAGGNHKKKATNTKGIDA